MTGVQGANPMAKGGKTDSFEPHYMYKGDRKILARDEEAHFRLKDKNYGHKKLAEGGYTSKESSLENLINTISMSTPGTGTIDKPKTEEETKELESISVMNAEIEALLPEGRYSNSQQQAQRDTIRAIKKIIVAFMRNCCFVSIENL